MDLNGIGFSSGLKFKDILKVDSKNTLNLKVI